MENLISVNNLSFVYERENFSLKSISFNVSGGDFISVIGRNGSGKSTLAKALARILTGYTGSIDYKGNDTRTAERKNFSRNVSYLPQSGILFNEDTKVYDFLLTGRYPYKGFSDFRYNNEDKRVVDESIRIAGIESFKDKYLYELSGGERQKVLITLSLVQLDITGDLRGKVLIVDEPLTHLDINYQHEIFGLLSRLNKEKGLTVLVIVHDLNLALKYTGKTLLMHNGEIAYYGASSEIITEDILSRYFLIESKVMQIGGDVFVNYLPRL